MECFFTVYGIPQPQGSTRAFIPKGWNRPIITSTNKNLKSWRQEVSAEASRVMKGQVLATGPICVEVAFYFDRPKSVKSDFKTTKPDIDKCLRGILDGLTGICFKDDSQVVHCKAWKLFGSPARVEIEATDHIKENLCLLKASLPKLTTTKTRKGT